MEPGIFLKAVALGIGATAVMDICWLAVDGRLGFPRPTYDLVGRWVGHMPKGTFRHGAISAAPPVPGERAIGWSTHYAVGAAFAALLLMLAGPGWLERPTPGPALLVGIGTVAIPMLLMQPAMGLGIAGRRTPHPQQVRARSLVSHSFFGIGLYVAGAAIAQVLS